MASNIGFDPPEATRSSNDALRVPGVAYLVNGALLICHEVDSAYWHEWELFHIPGGPTVFVALHLPLVAFVLYGLMQTARGDRTWRWYSLVTGVAGVCGGIVHISLLLAGSQPFSTWFSISLIAAFLLASFTQLVVTGLWWRETGHRDHASSPNGEAQ